MTQVLVAGANTGLPTDNITIRIISSNPIDCVAYRLTNNNKVRGDGDMIFYGQMQSDDRSVNYRGHETDCFFDLDLPKQPFSIEKIAIAFSSNMSVAQLGNIQLQVIQGSQVIIESEVLSQGRLEKALILAECYRRQGAWKFRFVSQGFDGGLKPLSEHFGVEIAEESSARSSNASTSLSTPPVPPIPKPSATLTTEVNKSSLNLNKITLTKNQSTINLAKKDDFGKISINLNWNQRSISNKSSLLGGIFGSQNSGIDLDLGAFIELSDGGMQVIQALGKNFGKFDQYPFLKLRADDRTGSSMDGEWIDINGKYWQNIREVLIYAFIYDGVPNWNQTDGVVTIHVPNQPPIETHLTEGTNRLGMCAIARLVNEAGSIKVERINQYFSDHKEMDKAMGWGFSWRAGSK
ncbi:TerD family protein [Moraxella osloensis]|nr:TerD family protein [Moraxella osloensis]MDK1670693.1 TerD family protein [Moraxella osloensis]